VECHFFFEIVAPKGLIGIEDALSKSGLGLSIYLSHFNNKNILKSDGEAIELGMDTSTTDIMHGSGIIYRSFPESVVLMGSLSKVFISMDYRHKIGVDSEDGSECKWINYNYA